jgi:ribosomal protein L11 methyltransferase
VGPDAASAPWFVVETWVEDDDELDALSGRLWAAGAAGIEERAAGTRTELAVSVSAGRVDAVEAALGARLRKRRREVDPDAGLDGWRDWAEPIRVGRVMIEPAWWEEDGDPRVRAGPAGVRIDPGRAFGSGSHATTRLSLELLQVCLRSGMSMLDVGTGSGVLAIAAARLGAAHVVAIDIDDEAKRAARANADRNGVGAIVEVADHELVDLDGDFDVVLANIDRPTLVELRPELVRRVRSGGHLVLSGFLTSNEPVVTAGVRGVRWTRILREGGWTAALGERAVSAGRSRPARET